LVLYFFAEIGNERMEWLFSITTWRAFFFLDRGQRSAAIN